MPVKEFLTELNASPERSASRALQDHDLTALRQLLLAKEREQLRQILHRLDDPAVRAEELAKVLPQAISLRHLEDEALTQALVPSIREALIDALRQQPSLLVAATRRALLDLLLKPWRLLTRIAARPSNTVPATIEQLLLIHRSSGSILQHAILPKHDPGDGSLAAEHRSITSMTTYLLAFLRDSENVQRYALLGHLRIEHLTYGIHISPHALLVSVIRSPINSTPTNELAVCEALLKQIEDTHAESLAHPLAPDLPHLLSLPLNP